MDTNRDAMLNEAKFKSERYANQLVRNAFPEVRNLETLEGNEYATKIYEQLQSGLEQFFNLNVPPAGEKDMCPVCGRLGIKESVIAHARLGEAQMWQRNGNNHDWASKRMGELEAAGKGT